MSELVVLVNEQDEQIGVMPKAEVHHASTPLHRAFSLFIFNTAGELLLQQRSHLKKTFPLVWSNSCCGHPAPGEAYDAAAQRRAKFELGLELEEITMVLPRFRYTAQMHGIVENEFCPVLISFINQPVQANPDEVETTRWLAWPAWVTEVTDNPQGYSAWCVQETLLLAENKDFQKLYQEKTE